MIYRSETMTLKCVMEIFRGKVNDAVICEDMRGSRGSYYTVLLIKDHETVRRVIRIMEKYGVQCAVDMFNWQNQYCVVFEYVKERRLESFYMPGELTLPECEEVCRNLLVQCMASRLPFPLLYLALRQRRIHLLKDRSVALGYEIDLEELDESCTEGDCAMECALLLREMLQEKATRRNVTYQLLLKKIPKRSYQSFRELYQDVRLTSSAISGQSLWKQIKSWYGRNQTEIFRALLVLSLILAVLALVMIFSEAVWGDIPFFRLFVNSFKRIGTESLAK